MRVPQVMASPRQLIHRAFCATAHECTYEGADDPSVWCELLDQLLQFNDEMLLHTTSGALQDEMRRVSTGRGGAGVAAGLYHGAVMIDPYTKIDAFDEDPDCPGCVKGVEHFHRKADDSPVRAPGEDVPRETSTREETP